MLKLDKNTVADFESKGVQKIKIFFYSAGCSGTKIDIALDDFEITNDIVLINNSFEASQELQKGEYPFKIYVEIKDAEKFKNASITRVLKADHTGEAKPRYIYTSDEVQERCGCGTSFAFEKKKPKFDFTKLKYLKTDFKK